MRGLEKPRLGRAAAEPRVPGAYYLVPAAERAQREGAGYTMMAESMRKRGANVALMRAAE